MHLGQLQHNVDHKATWVRSKKVGDYVDDEAVEWIDGWQARHGQMWTWRHVGQ